MKTPICDFVENYILKGTERFHMPAHKGNPYLGFEPYDITEIKGADSLYEAKSILKQSEDNASMLFSYPTFYSTEGSSQCIRAMLYLAVKKTGSKKILAARNAHKAFITAAALLDLDVAFLYGNSSYLSCEIDLKELENAILKEKPGALYITSPDYLGCILDIEKISEVCKKYGVLLVVDNAHGAYLKFLPNSLFPLDLGADICCDSAHKTLPCLTGGAYLHIKDECLAKEAKDALSLFGSTSPSYLILQSLDMLNKYLSDDYSIKLKDFIIKVTRLKKVLKEKGYCLYENEPFKITLCTKAYGYSGLEFSELLRSKNIECEFADPDFLVLMSNIENDLEYLEKSLLEIPQKDAIPQFAPIIKECEKVVSIKEATFSQSEEILVDDAEGRILATLNVGCPPAIPIAVCGERLNKSSIESFKYYGIKNIKVIKR